MMCCRWYLLIVIFLLITGCNTFTSNKPRLPPLPHFTPSLSVKKSWQITLGNTKAHYVILTPAYTDGNLFVTTPDGTVTAITAKTGDVLWHNQLPQAITTGPGVGSGLVVVGTTRAQIFALDEKTGDIIWTAKLSNPVLAIPVIAQNQVLVKTQDDHLYIFDTSGKVVWTYQQSVPDLVLRAGGSPQIVGDWVVAGFANGKFVVLNRQNGQVLWQEQLDSASGISDLEHMTDIDSTPLIREKVAYISAYQGQLLALDLTTQQTLWQQTLSADTNLAGDSQQIYTADTAGNLWAFDHDSGAVEWKQSILAGRELTAPVLLGRRLVVGDAQGNLYWLAVDDGRLLAQVALDDAGISADPVVVNQKICIYTNSSKLMLLQPIHS